MNLEKLLTSEDDLVFTAELEEHMDRFLDAATAPELCIGIVGERFPLLANLSVLENVALQSMYQANKSVAWVHNRVAPYIEQLALEEAMGKRRADLSEEELFNVLLLRCLAVRCRAVLLVQPEPWNCGSTYNFVKGIDANIRLWICCFRDVAAQYASLHLRQIAIE